MVEWMNNLLVKLKKDWRVYFCYLLVLGGILFALAIVIFKPMKINTSYYYEYKNKITLESINFPVLQHIRFQDDNLKTLNIYFNDMSINDFSYKISLVDEIGNEYFSNSFDSNNEKWATILLDNVSLKKDYDYVLRIDCPDCRDVSISMKEASNEFTYLEGFDNKSLEITTNYFSRNYGFYWYSAMMIVIGLTLLPTAKDNKTVVSGRGNKL